MTIKAQEILAEMNRLVGEAEARNIQLRAIGGLAVLAHNKSNHPLLMRDFADLDFVVAKRQRREFEAFMPEVGYTPNKRFNLLNGSERQIYNENKTDMKVDIFVGDFEMCHKIPLEDRLKFDSLTIPLVELFLSKTQIVELNHKDMLDIVSILFNNETGDDDIGKINLRVLTQLCSQDWGLYKTTSINLERVRGFITGEAGFSQEDRDLVLDRIRVIERVFEEMPKPMAWQLRDRVGTRVKWYIEVEEIDR